MRCASIILTVALCGCSAAARDGDIDPGGAEAPPLQPASAEAEPCVITGVTEAARCATITVRESPAGSRTIDLRVVIISARGETLRADPIVALVGGPGQGAAALATGMAQRYAALREDRELLLIDQRGTGDSNLLQCESPLDTNQLMGSLFDPRELATCRDQLSARADLTQYTTTQAARDHIEVFDRLGYDTVNLLGVSYGTRMALEIARQQPRRVRSMVLDGVVPMDFSWPTSGAADADAALDALFEMCASDIACASAYPRFRQDVDIAFTRARQPVQVEVRDPATGATVRVPFGSNDLAYAVRGSLYNNEAFSLPLWFRRAADGDFSAFAQAYVARARTLDAQIAYGVHFGVYCAEDLPFVDWTRAAQAAGGTRLGTFLLEEYRRACEVWPRATISDGYRTAVASTVPALLFSGRRDPVTPPRNADTVARALTRSRTVVWPNGGHGSDGLASGECRVAILREFLRTADPGAPSFDCVTRDPARPWVF